MKADLLDDDAPARPRRRSTAPWIVAVCAALPLIVAAAIYFWNDTHALFQLKGGTGAAGVLESKKESLLGAAALAADDPALRFSETRVGQVVFSTTSDICRRHLFDNRTGRSYWVDDLPCGRKAVTIADDEPPHRLNALKKSFQR
jgi:hypothetical protein